jgi:hypothetical protein
MAVPGREDLGRLYGADKGLKMCHDVLGKVNSVIFWVMLGSVIVNGAEDTEVARVEGGRVGVTEDGNELVAEDFDVGDHE